MEGRQKESNSNFNLNWLTEDIAEKQPYRDAVGLLAFLSIVCRFSFLGYSLKLEMSNEIYISTLSLLYSSWKYGLRAAREEIP
jgi:hypothetical protein